MMLENEIKPLKASKKRIVLFDNRELQYHTPEDKVDPKNLEDYLPKKTFEKLEVEVGCGKGEFIFRRAKLYPDSFFIGIDRRLDRVRLSEKKFNRVEENNCLVIREDACSFLKTELPAIDVFHLYQPDPWPKAKHHKHRFFRSPEAKIWAEAIRSGGELRLSTDNRGYFEEMLDIVYSWKLFAPAIIHKKEFYMSPAMTHFEGIFMRKNEPVYKAVFVRLGQKTISV